MTTAEKIQDICNRIARDFHPDKIIVFGSHAYGSPGPFSDLDLLVVMPFDGSPLQQAARIITRVDPDIGIDLIVRTPAQVSGRLAMQDAFMREILERGRVAYEADHLECTFAVAYRYPGASATGVDAKDALKRCQRIRKVIRTAFGLPVT